MPRHRREFLLGSIAAAGALAGCSGPTDGGDDATPTAADTPAATPADTPTGTTTATPGGAEVDYGDWFADTSNYDGTTVDARGESTVTVRVGVQANGGAFGFGPPAVWVDPRTTVRWAWTGEGGSHNVVATDDSFRTEGSLYLANQEVWVSNWGGDFYEGRGVPGQSDEPPQ